MIDIRLGEECRGMPVCPGGQPAARQQAASEAGSRAPQLLRRWEACVCWDYMPAVRTVWEPGSKVTLPSENQPDLTYHIGSLGSGLVRSCQGDYCSWSVLELQLLISGKIKPKRVRHN